MVVLGRATIACNDCNRTAGSILDEIIRFSDLDGTLEKIYLQPDRKCYVHDQLSHTKIII
jgi:hypothetical protein